MNNKERDGLEDLLKEAREEEVKIGQKKTFKRLQIIVGVLILLNVIPGSIYILSKAKIGKAIVRDLLILQFIAIPLISLLLSILIGIIPFNRWRYRKRLYLSFLILVLSFSSLLTFTFLFEFLILR